MIPRTTGRTVQSFLLMTMVVGVRRLAGQPPIAITARTVGLGLVVVRRWLGEALDQVQLVLKGLETRGDPDDAEWVRKTLDSVNDGSIKQQLAGQPTPEQIVEWWRSSRAS